MGTTNKTTSLILFLALLMWGGCNSNSSNGYKVNDGRRVQPGEVLIPSGTFMMGSPTNEFGHQPSEAQHQVTLTRPFYMWKYEVTQSEFQNLMGYNHSKFKSCGKNCPVEQVTWHEALAFANALSRASKLPECFNCTGDGAHVVCEVKSAYTGSNYYNCKGYRLPTEAEWEYAYRAGSVTAFYNGDMTDSRCWDPNANVLGWYCGNADMTTHPVGGKLPNTWGLYDMAGNVYEWVYDGYTWDYPTQATTNPVRESPDRSRIYRGGSWLQDAYNLRAAFREGLYTATHYSSDFGFRVVRSSL
jgi:formylglycine-generating enzyme required for sulfatase activity